MHTATDSHSSHRILLVDDNPAIHEDFRKILQAAPPEDSALDDVMASVFGERPRAASRHADFEIDSAHQGEEALGRVVQSIEEGRPYAMAFVDMRMPPGWDGVETITRIWEKDASIQIVICTAYSDYSWQEIVTQLGNSDRLVILKKPFDSIEVLQLAHAMTKKWLVTRQAGQKLDELDRLVHEQTEQLRASNKKLLAEMAERELAEKALRISEERITKGFDACPLPIAILRLHDHTCVEMNRAFVEATGYSREELIDRSPWNAGLSLDAKSRLDAMGRIAEGRSVHQQGCRIISKAGDDRAALLWLEPFDLATGPHLLAIVQDVSEQHRLESQLRQAQKVEAVGHLAAGVAHDLNNLLTVILGHTSLQMERPGLDGGTQAALGEVKGAGERAAALIRQLLAFSRKQVMCKRAVVLSSVISNVQAMLRRLIPENIDLSIQSPPLLPPVHADVCNLEQVLVNLVVNARDAMPDGGVIAVRTGEVQLDASAAARHPDARPGHFVRLIVTDTGTGMDEETMAKVFEPFFTTKEVGKGTGMGLATVVGIVNQHQGWIEVRSAVGRGTTFEVFLPVTEQQVEPRPQAVRTDAVSEGREIILVVEDDPNVRSLARCVLEAAGHRVLEAADGIQAVALWRTFEDRIDILLTDMVMPGGLSGCDVAERFRAERPEGKILYSSGYSVELFADDLDLREGVNYLPKPYFAHQLTSAIARARASDAPAGCVSAAA
ncbi:MAG: response regulator [Verrucomicrobiaceae bacterium]|nr:response regulator [Verrucomicrobiaceae bacterium]